jgi:multicomponent Na+:H+ antiporter subunit F
LYDRVLAGNAFGTYTVLFIGVLGFLTGRPDFLDIALLYALINFVGTIAVLKYFRYRAIGDTSPAPRGTPAERGRLKDQGAKS